MYLIVTAWGARWAEAARGARAAMRWAKTGASEGRENVAAVKKMPIHITPGKRYFRIKKMHIFHNTASRTLPCTDE